MFTVLVPVTGQSGGPVSSTSIYVSDSLYVTSHQSTRRAFTEETVVSSVLLHPVDVTVPEGLSLVWSVYDR